MGKRRRKIKKGTFLPKDRTARKQDGAVPRPTDDAFTEDGDREALAQMIADSDQDLKVTLVNDFAFKHVFHNKKALTGLLGALLDIPPEDIVDLELLDTFQPGTHPGDKTGILDIKIRLNSSQKINIEMQVRQQEGWKERSLFYLGRMYTADLASGEDYTLLEPCIHISILDFPVPDLSRLYSIVRLIEEHTGQVYSDKLGLRVLYLRKLENADEEERRTEVYRWAKLITAKDWEELWEMARQDEYKAEAVKEMERINTDRALRYEYISREIARIDAAVYARDRERLRAGQEELRSGQEELRSGQEELRSGQEELRSGQEELRSGQEELRTSQENLHRYEEDINRRKEIIDRRECDIDKREADINIRKEEIEKRKKEIDDQENRISQRQEEMRRIQIMLQLARLMMAAGESELFLKLDQDPELFRQKIREYHLDI